MASDLLTKIHVWGWQLIILGAAITLPLGITQSKEYAELEWFLDIAVALVWVAFGVNFFWTLKIRNEKNLYVALWFYIATIVTIALLYIVNNLALPVTAGKSYGLFAGGQDALTQWWYGHNAVAFFLTTPILGVMYYFLPKAAGRPVYSYRLSIVHFWALVFIYIWAGPHHLLYTALPEWAQSLGMLFSLMLWAPSWGGMLNGLLTLRGAWDKLRTDPVLKFFAAGVTFYGMSDVRGPAALDPRGLGARALHRLDHRARARRSARLERLHGRRPVLLARSPKLYGRPLFSTNMANWHFWIGTFGILIYVVSMWVAGVTEGLMWRAQTPDGGLANPDWIVIIEKTQIMYWARSLGGTLYIVGWLMMVVNLWKTAMRLGEAITSKVEVLVPKQTGVPVSDMGLVFGKPTVVTLLALGAAYMMSDSDNVPLSVVGVVIFPDDRGGRYLRLRRSPSQRSQVARRSRAQAARVHAAGRSGRRRRWSRRAPAGHRHPQGSAGLAERRVRSQAVHRARTDRSRHLRARGLLRLPLADDSSAARGVPTVRQGEPSRGVDVGPPVPVG